MVYIYAQTAHIGTYIHTNKPSVEVRTCVLCTSAVLCYKPANLSPKAKHLPLSRREYWHAHTHTEEADCLFGFEFLPSLEVNVPGSCTCAVVHICHSVECSAQPGCSHRLPLLYHMATSKQNERCPVSPAHGKSTVYSMNKVVHFVVSFTLPFCNV